MGTDKKITKLKRIKWGILGTGSIAKKFAKDMFFSNSGEVFAVASRDIQKAKDFAKKFNVKRFYASYDELINDKEVEVVYIALPNTLHKEWCIKAAQKKKHILCEKPLAVNYQEVKNIIDEAKKNKVFLMEAFMYRCHPQILELIKHIKNKTIGDIKQIQASFGLKKEYDPEHRLFNPNLAGGSILDLGCYTVSISRLIAGVSCGKYLSEPKEIIATGKIGSSKVDEYASALLKFESDIIAEVSCSITFYLENKVRVFGTDGTLILEYPWFANLEKKIPSEIVILKGKDKKILKVKEKRPLYTIEIDKVNEFIIKGKKQAPYPYITWDDSLGNIKVLDKWREEIGLKYDFEN